MEVRLAHTAGFCFGVQRAVDAVEEALRAEEAKPEGERRKIYTFGPIVHNETVVEGFRRRGVGILEDAGQSLLYKEDVPREGVAGDWPVPGKPLVIIRAHGVSEAVYRELEALGYVVVDASCPFVRKIQRIVREKTEQGIRVFLAGDISHPEVEGIVGWAKGEVTVLPDAKDALKVGEGTGEEACLLAQTTFHADKFKEILAILQKKGYDINVINTICNATLERQAEAKDLAGRSDAMIVIGGSSSSNTKKLFEICRAECQYTQLIQTVKDLQFERDEAIRNVGITAGASTPKEIIEEVLTYVRNEFRTNA